MNHSKQYYILYETTNLVNGKYYIGVHGCDSIEFDGYLGSGTALKNTVKKHGRNNFMRETLFVFDNVKEAYNKEKAVVNEYFIKNENNYNLCLGGLVPAFITKEIKAKMSESMSGIPKSISHKAKISVVHKGKIISGETRTKQSASTKGIPKSIITCPHCNKSGGIPAMKRWHFNNCKARIISTPS